MRQFETDTEGKRLAGEGCKAIAASRAGIRQRAVLHHYTVKNSSVYDAAIRKQLKGNKSGEELFLELELEDLCQAADLFRPIYDQTDGMDGWVWKITRIRKEKPMMKRDLLKTTFLRAVLVAWMAGLPGAVPAAGTPAVKQKVELLLVQNSKGVAIDKNKGTLTLKGVGATTLFFSDRPVRMAGHFNKEDYLKLWTDGKDSFDADPPNATLSVFEGGQDDLLDVVVKLQNPRYQGDDLIYDITLIDGQLPK
ncbi:MAG: hypothetical protein WB818_02440, partial [Desulfobacterales bacterium]